ncbi:hypothetical protein B0H17DRAFT_1128591 [Mycena rosella]|uniref:Uncharacterized protein n=1 Tax=Mycena rosella TaxID=1033263 RepID=A0AAD7DWH8_MYCRO|nr:hypothetical protein B0H17DRAFT_1128591 [Mycena rosella]
MARWWLPLSGSPSSGPDVARRNWLRSGASSQSQCETVETQGHYADSRRPQIPGARGIATPEDPSPQAKREPKISGKNGGPAGMQDATNMRIAGRFLMPLRAGGGGWAEGRRRSKLMLRDGEEEKPRDFGDTFEGAL